MLVPLAVTLATVFGALSALHWYWVVVGVRAGGPALPEVAGRPAFQPGRPVTAAVALALAAAGLTVLACARVVDVGLGAAAPRWATIGLGILFLLRAVGDLRLVGFFKSVRGTRFARWDTALFSPLCLAVGLACLGLAALSRGVAR